MLEDGGEEELLLKEPEGSRRVMSGGLKVRHGGGILGTQELLGEGSPLQHLFRVLHGNAVSWVTDWLCEEIARSLGVDYILRIREGAERALTGRVARSFPQVCTMYVPTWGYRVRV